MSAVSTPERAPQRLPLIRRPRLRRPRLKNARQSFLLTFIAVALLAGFLSPLLRSVSVSIKNAQQVNTVGAPILPSDPKRLAVNGKTYDIYQVPIDGTLRELALVRKGRTDADFLDPANPSAPPITWQGSWRSLTPAWELAPHPENYVNAWNLIKFPRLLFNTIVLALIGMVGTLISCTLVAYGFARFRFPGRNALFILLIATIFLPATVTIVPTYTTWVWLGMLKPEIGYLAWAPLLVPTFFANAYDVFLMRQYFLTIPREMDEAAAMDGAGPFRTLISVILPQSWPVIIAVGIFHFIYAWNDFFGPLIYLGAKPDLQPLSVGLASFNAIRAVREPGVVQAGTIMTLLIPVVLFVIFQRVFTRGIVITGVEK
ncbi:MAG: multiple sugar transport system permease protein [Chloroflexota bacterium]|jgi:multiple sugar transport system permease protein|nr:multiple sugar transport system permease protein [Chloroflexota bacterium]